MNPAAVDSVLGVYPNKDLHSAYAPSTGSAKQTDDIHFQFRKVNDKEIVVIRFGDRDTLVFQPFATPEAISAYLGEAPDNAKRVRR